MGHDVQELGGGFRQKIKRAGGSQQVPEEQEELYLTTQTRALQGRVRKRPSWPFPQSQGHKLVSCRCPQLQTAMSTARWVSASAGRVAPGGKDWATGQPCPAAEHLELPGPASLHRRHPSWEGASTQLVGATAGGSGRDVLGGTRRRGWGVCWFCWTGKATDRLIPLLPTSLLRHPYQTFHKGAWMVKRPLRFLKFNYLFQKINTSSWSLFCKTWCNLTSKE